MISNEFSVTGFNLNPTSGDMTPATTGVNTTLQASDTFKSASTILKDIYYMGDHELIKYIMDSRAPKKTTKELSSLLSDFMKDASGRIDSMLRTSTTSLSMQRRINYQTVIGQQNSIPYPQTTALSLLPRFNYAWTFKDQDAGSTNDMRTNAGPADLSVNQCTTLLPMTYLETQIAEVKRDPLIVCDMDIQARNIMQDRSNVSDYASTQGRNTNGFYSPILPLESSPESMLQSTAYYWYGLWSLLIAYTDYNADRSQYPSTGVTDYARGNWTTKKGDLAGVAWSRASWDKGSNQWNYNVYAQYTTLGWLLARGTNTNGAPAVPAGSPAARWLAGGDSSQVIVVPFFGSNRYIPSHYITAHFPQPFYVAEGSQSYTVPGTAYSSTAEYCHNLSLTRIDNDRYILDPVNTDVNFYVLFVNVLDLDLTCDDTIVVNTTNNAGVINMPNMYNNPINMDVNLLAGPNFENLLSSFEYMQQMYPDSHGLDYGFKTALYFSRRTNIAGWTETLNANNVSGTALTHTNASAGSMFIWRGGMLLDGTKIQVNEAAEANFEDRCPRSIAGQYPDASATFRCLLGAKRIIDPLWSKHQYATRGGWKQFLPVTASTPILASVEAFIDAVYNVYAFVVCANGLTNASLIDDQVLSEQSAPFRLLRSTWVDTFLPGIRSRKYRQVPYVMGKYPVGIVAPAFNEPFFQSVCPIPFNRQLLYFLGARRACVESLYSSTITRYKLPYDVNTNASYLSNNQCSLNISDVISRTLDCYYFAGSALAGGYRVNTQLDVTTAAIPGRLPFSGNVLGVLGNANNRLEQLVSISDCCMGSLWDVSYYYGNLYDSCVTAVVSSLGFYRASDKIIQSSEQNVILRWRSGCENVFCPGIILDSNTATSLPHQYDSMSMWDYAYEATDSESDDETSSSGSNLKH